MQTLNNKRKGEGIASQEIPIIRKKLSRHAHANRNKKQKCDHKQNKVFCKPEVAKPIIKDDIIFDSSW
ncbi:23046_t:CDS:1, partial [Cetraspora pellucida]